MRQILKKLFRPVRFWKKVYNVSVFGFEKTRQILN